MHARQGDVPTVLILCALQILPHSQIMCSTHKPSSLETLFNAAESAYDIWNEQMKMKTEACVKTAYIYSWVLKEK